MLHKCANPACVTSFRKLSQGKLFLLETDPIEKPESKRVTRRGQRSHRMEYYWLCDLCADTLTLFYERGRGLVTVAQGGDAKKSPASALHTTDSVRDSRTERSA